MEYVLNISISNKHRLYPFSGMQNQPIIIDEIDGTPVVVLSRPGTYSALDGGNIVGSRLMPSATAFGRHLDGQTLSFSLADGKIIDDQTGSVWNVLGRSQSGPLAGKQLDSVPSGVHFAFAWLAFNPNSELFDQ